ATSNPASAASRQESGGSVISTNRRPSFTLGWRGRKNRGNRWGPPSPPSSWTRTSRKSMCSLPGLNNSSSRERNASERHIMNPEAVRLILKENNIPFAEKPVPHGCQFRFKDGRDFERV